MYSHRTRRIKIHVFQNKIIKGSIIVSYCTIVNRLWLNHHRGGWGRNVRPAVYFIGYFSDFLSIILIFLMLSLTICPTFFPLLQCWTNGIVKKRYYAISPKVLTFSLIEKSMYTILNVKKFGRLKYSANNIGLIATLV